MKPADSPSLNLLFSLRGHGDRIWHTIWNHRGDILASCSSDKTIRIWQQRGDQWVNTQVITGHDRTVRKIAFSPDDRFLASSSFDSTSNIYEWTDEEFQFIQQLEGHESEVKGIAWSSSGNYLATCSRDKSIWIYEKDPDSQFSSIAICQSHSQDVKSVLWHPEKDILISCSYDDTIKVWEQVYDDWVCIETLTDHKSTVWDAVFEPKFGRYLISTSEDASLILWKLVNENGAESDHRFYNVSEKNSVSTRSLYSIDWSPKNNLIACGGGDDNVYIYRLSTGEKNNEPSVELLLKKEKAHQSDVNCIRWHPSEHLLASCGDDCLINIWHIQNLPEQAQSL